MLHGVVISHVALGQRRTPEPAARRHGFSYKNHRGVHANDMPIEYLLEIEHAPFPFRVSAPDAIRYIAVLKAVGFVEAEIYPELDLRARFGDYQSAVVSGITAHGRAELSRQWATT